MPLPISVYNVHTHPQTNTYPDLLTCVRAQVVAEEEETVKEKEDEEAGKDGGDGPKESFGEGLFHFFYVLGGEGENQNVCGMLCVCVHVRGGGGKGMSVRSSVRIEE